MKYTGPRSLLGGYSSPRGYPRVFHRVEYKPVSFTKTSNVPDSPGVSEPLMKNQKRKHLPVNQ